MKMGCLYRLRLICMQFAQLRDLSRQQPKRFVSEREFALWPGPAIRCDAVIRPESEAKQTQCARDEHFGL